MLLSRMVQHKSYTQTDGERVLVEFMADQLRQLGLDTELTPVPGNRINVVGRWRGTGGGKSLLFNGHVDTNPVTEGWTVDPWEGKVDDAFIYGIGVSNMKAGDCAYFCAVKTLLDAGVKLRGDVILTFVVGELQGGVGTKALMDAGLRADYFVNSEPTDLQAMTMHAAAFTFIIELVGKTRHLSKREEAVDAIVAACDLIPRLNAMTFSDAPSDAHRSINRVHVGVMHGALGRDLAEWRPAQVADYVRLQGSGRYAPGQTEAHAIEGHAARARCTRDPVPRSAGNADARAGAGPGDHAALRSCAGQSHRASCQCRLPGGAGRGAADRSGASARLLRHRCGPSAGDGRHGGRRLWTGRPLQHDAGRTGRPDRFFRHGSYLHPDYSGHLRTELTQL